MKQKKKHRPTDETLSWKELLRLYRKIRIPWGMLILVGGFSLLIKQAQLWLVPYTSKIMTGAITEHGFIAGFVGFTLLYLLALLLGLFALGWRFVASTIASSLLYPFFLGLMQRIPGIDSLTTDPLLAAILAGGIMGISIGLVMRVGSSTGGTDVVNLVLHKWTHIPVSVAVYVTDFVIMAGQAVFSDPEQLLYGFVLLVIQTIALDRVMLVGSSQILIFVISDLYEKIRQLCLTEMRCCQMISITHI